MGARIKACYPEFPPMVGFAATATFRSASPAENSAYASIEDQVAEFGALASPPVVVFQDLDDPPVAATFGEIMCTTYKTFGAAGLITSGAGRDLEQVRALQFPVFTEGTICAHGYCHIPSINVPVRVGGIMIRPGDLLHGDLNGVTTIPLEIASEVADACAEFMLAEKIVLDYLKRSNPTQEGLRRAMSEMKNEIKKLGERIRKKS